MYFKNEAVMRGIVYFLTVVLTITAINFFKPTYLNEPHGIVLPAKRIKPASQASTIRLLPFAPAKYQTLGVINIERHFAGQPSEKLSLDVENYARQLAAEVGANTIIVTSFGHTSVSDTGPSSSLYVFKGLAVYTQNVEGN